MLVELKLYILRYLLHKNKEESHLNAKRFIFIYQYKTEFISMYNSLIRIAYGLARLDLMMAKDKVWPK